MSFINITAKKKKSHIICSNSKIFKLIYHDRGGFKIYFTNSLCASLQRVEPINLFPLLSVG